MNTLIFNQIFIFVNDIIYLYTSNLNTLIWNTIRIYLFENNFNLFHIIYVLIF